MKKIELCKMRAGDIKTEFGNPRKISKGKLQDLENSLENYGDFGIFLIDEQDNVISGNQRLKAILAKFGPDTILDCKRLIGYTKAELRAINVKCNVHNGEWDLDMLADWSIDAADIDLSKLEDEEDPGKREIPEMELIHYEKYDYVMICCNSELDYNDLVRKLGIEGKKVSVSKRKINARAIWYHQMKAVIVPEEEYERLKELAYGKGN